MQNRGNCKYRPASFPEGYHLTVAFLTILIFFLFDFFMYFHIQNFYLRTVLATVFAMLTKIR